MTIDRTLSLAIVATAVAALVELFLPGRRTAWLRLLLQGACLAVLSVTLFRDLGSPFAPVPMGTGARRAIGQILAVAWWAIAARLTVAASRLALTRETRPRESRILLDLLAGLIYLAAALGVVAFVFGIPVSGLLATSGVIAIVLGLALQSTLGDLFSGIAVGVERPYRAGDQISVDGAASGRVVQINWRSTHIRTGNDLAIVPNSTMAKARLVNHSQPTPHSIVGIDLRVHPDVPSVMVLAVLRAALSSCGGIAAEVAATAYCNGLAGDGASYTINVGADTMDHAAAVRSDVLSQVQRHLYHAGIPLAVTGVLPAEPWRARALSAEQLLSRSDLFGAVSDAHRPVLARRLSAVELEAGAVLFRKGAPPEAMFLIASGTIEILTGDAKRPIRHLVAPGETVGVVGLVAQQPYGATATALNAVRAFRLDPAGLAEALSEAPGLAAELEDAVRRALVLRARLDVSEDVDTEHKGPPLLDRLRRFLAAIR